MVLCHVISCVTKLSNGAKSTAVVCETCGCLYSIYEQYGSFLLSIMCTNTILTVDITRTVWLILLHIVGFSINQYGSILKQYGSFLKSIFVSQYQEMVLDIWYRWLKICEQYGYILLHLVGFSMNQYGSICKQYGSFLQSILCNNTKKWRRE